jgi:hypothetical protein
VNDAKLWKVFSEFIRLRDADENGLCKCFTCGLVRPWRNMDCGHGIGRQHKSTKFNELNNHAQCKRCNGFEGGKREVYKQRVDELYGEGTWDKLEIASRQTVKRGKVEIEIMTAYYKEKVLELKREKGLLTN